MWQYHVPTMSSPGCIIPAMAEGLSTEQVEVELIEGNIPCAMLEYLV